ncbi:MAG: acyl-CoA dehydrogenase family protein [Actinomycetota bacterium]
MDFTFDETQTDLRGLARGILDKATPARVGEIEASDDAIDRELWMEFANADLLGVALPEEVGGSGHGIMELCVLLEEVGRRVVPIPLFSTIGLGALPIARFGTTDQRKRFLVPVLEGTSLLTAALQEPNRHDPLEPSTTAEWDGSNWRLDGIKVAVPHGTLAERILVSARTSARSTALFALDPAAPGVVLEPMRSTHRQLQANLILDGAVVGEEDVIGDPRSGNDQLEFSSRHAIAGMCATAVGVLDEALRITAGYISERKQFEKPIAAFQGATLKAADAYIDTEAVRATAWSAIWRLAAGLPCDDELAIAKYWVAFGGQNAVHNCQHLHGGMGVDVDYPIHRYFIWAKELELALGGATPQLLKIGASLAGDS